MQRFGELFLGQSQRSIPWGRIKFRLKQVLFPWANVHLNFSETRSIFLSIVICAGHVPQFNDSTSHVVTACDRQQKVILSRIFCIVTTLAKILEDLWENIWSSFKILGDFCKILNETLKELLWRTLRTLEDPSKTFTMFYLQIGIIENMTELRPSVCQVAGEQGMLGWLLRRLKVSGTSTDWQGFSICIWKQNWRPS